MSIKSEAESYFRKDAEEEIYYDIFFRMCRKYNINWSNASSKERAFIEEVTRVTYEMNKAGRTGASIESVQPAFAS